MEHNNRKQRRKGRQSNRKTEEFFRQMGLRTRMSEYGILAEAVDIIYNRLKAHNIAYGENKNVTAEVAREIYTGCL